MREDLAYFKDGDTCVVRADHRDPLEIRSPAAGIAPARRVEAHVRLQGVALRFGYLSTVPREPLGDNDWAREMYQREGLHFDGDIPLVLGHRGSAIARTGDGSLRFGANNSELWFDTDVSAETTGVLGQYLPDLRRYKTLAVSTEVYPKTTVGLR